jgi:hypothetical protein
MRNVIRLTVVAGVCLCVLAWSIPAYSAGIEVNIEVMACQAPLDQSSTCQLRASWTGGSGRLKEIVFLEAVKQSAQPTRQDFRVTLRARPDELAAPPVEGIRRTRKTEEFGSWLFEGKKPWTYCVKARVKDDAGAQGESQPICLAGNP